MNRIKLLLFTAGVFISTFACAQDNLENKSVYTLQELINIARKQSIAAKYAETTRENRFWQFQSYKSNYKPQLGIDGAFPGYNRSFRDVEQNDGTIRFLPVQYNNSDINLRLQQPFAPTGATIFLNSGINRFDNFLDEPDMGLEKYHQYSGTPLEIGIVQPLFQYNDLKWDRKTRNTSLRWLRSTT